MQLRRYFLVVCLIASPCSAHLDARVRQESLWTGFSPTDDPGLRKEPQLSARGTDRQREIVRSFEINGREEVDDVERRNVFNVYDIRRDDQHRRDVFDARSSPWATFGVAQRLNSQEVDQAEQSRHRTDVRDNERTTILIDTRMDRQRDRQTDTRSIDARPPATRVYRAQTIRDLEATSLNRFEYQPNTSSGNRRQLERASESYDNSESHATRRNSEIRAIVDISRREEVRDREYIHRTDSATRTDHRRGGVWDADTLREENAARGIVREHRQQRDIVRENEHIIMKREQQQQRHDHAQVERRFRDLSREERRERMETRDKEEIIRSHNRRQERERSDVRSQDDTRRARSQTERDQERDNVLDREAPRIRSENRMRRQERSVEDRIQTGASRQGREMSADAQSNDLRRQSTRQEERQKSEDRSVATTRNYARYDRENRQTKRVRTDEPRQIDTRVESSDRRRENVDHTRGSERVAGSRHNNEQARAFSFEDRELRQLARHRDTAARGYGSVLEQEQRLEVRHSLDRTRNPQADAHLRQLDNQPYQSRSPSSKVQADRQNSEQSERRRTQGAEHAVRARSREDRTHSHRGDEREIRADYQRAEQRRSEDRRNEERHSSDRVRRRELSVDVRRSDRSIPSLSRQQQQQWNTDGREGTARVRTSRECQTNSDNSRRVDASTDTAYESAGEARRDEAVRGNHEGGEARRDEAVRGVRFTGALEDRQERDAVTRAANEEERREDVRYRQEAERRQEEIRACEVRHDSAAQLDTRAERRPDDVYHLDDGQCAAPRTSPRMAENRYGREARSIRGVRDDALGDPERVQLQLRLESRREDNAQFTDGGDAELERYSARYERNSPRSDSRATLESIPDDTDYKERVDIARISANRDVSTTYAERDLIVEEHHLTAKTANAGRTIEQSLLETLLSAVFMAATYRLKHISSQSKAILGEIY